LSDGYVFPSVLHRESSWSATFLQHRGPSPTSNCFSDIPKAYKKLRTLLSIIIDAFILLLVVNHVVIDLRVDVGDLAQSALNGLHVNLFLFALHEEVLPPFLEQFMLVLQSLELGDPAM
jgi:hypothetical protein